MTVTKTLKKNRLDPSANPNPKIMEEAVFMQLNAFMVQNHSSNVFGLEVKNCSDSYSSSTTLQPH